MRIFIHEGRGHYICSVVIFASDNLQEAELKIREYLDQIGLKGELLNVKEWINADKNNLIYGQNGDY